MDQNIQIMNQNKTKTRTKISQIVPKIDQKKPRTKPQNVQTKMD